MKRGTVVIFVMVLLLGLVYVGTPTCSKISARPPRIVALGKAKQVHLALYDYAFDHDGKFPEAMTNSNAAFRQVYSIPGIRCIERLFFVEGSAWHEALPWYQTQPDEKIGEAPDYVHALERGENSWAYQSGLDWGCKGNLPVIMNGFSDSVGVYVFDPRKRGGVWSGEAVVVTRADGSAKLEKPAPDGRVYEKRVSGEAVDIFSERYGTDPQKLLNPW